MEDDIVYDYWWAGMPRCYPGQIRHIANAAGSARRLYEMDKAELMTIDGISEKYADDIIEKKKSWDLYGEYEKLMNSLPKRTYNLGICFTCMINQMITHVTDTFTITTSCYPMCFSITDTTVINIIFDDTVT